MSGHPAFSGDLHGVSVFPSPHDSAPEAGRLAALGRALSLPPSRLCLQEPGPAAWRNAAHASLRAVLCVDAEPRYSVKWFPSSRLPAFSALLSRPAAFSRATGLRTPLFVARGASPEGCFLVEELIRPATSLLELLQSGRLSTGAAAALHQKIFDAQFSSPPPPATPATDDEQRCLRSLRWLGEGSADHAAFESFVRGGACWSPELRLLHEDLLPGNILLPSETAPPVVVDFDHCLPSRMPWYAAWRVSWFSPLPDPALPATARPPCLEAAGAAASAILRRLCITLEVERQFEVLERDRFIHDWNIAWRQMLLEGRESVPGARSESERLSGSLSSPP